MDRSERLREGLTLSGVVFLTWALRSAVLAALGADGLALGADPSLWALNAKNLTHGVAAYVPPLYPWLIGGIDAVSNLGLAGSGQLASGLALAGLGAAIYAVARVSGASRGLACGAALALGALPDLIVFGVQLQPEALTALVLVGALPVVTWFVRAPTLRRSLGLAGYGALAYACREQGAILIGGFFLLALLVPGAGALRAARAAVVGGAILLTPVVGLSPPAPPWASGWSERVELATQLKETFPDARSDSSALASDHRTAHNRRDVLGILLVHGRIALRGAPVAWLWIALGGLSSLLLSRERRLAVLLGLAPALATLPILSQARHVLVEVPVALVAVVAALSATEPRSSRRGAQLAIGVVAGGLAIAGMQLWTARLAPVIDNVAVARLERSFGQSICAAVGEDALLAGETRAYQVYCPLRRHRIGRALADADWRTIAVATSAPGQYWQATGLSLSSSSETLRTWMLAPWLASNQRPCQSAAVPARTPFASPAVAPVVLAPACGGTSNLSLLVSNGL